MAEIDTVDSWLTENRDKKGTPEFEQNLTRYRELRTQEKAGAAPATDTPFNPTSARSALADKFGSFVKTAGEDTAANPGGVSATTGRVITGAATGIPDLGIGLYNAGARATGNPDSQVTPLGPQVNAALGGADMPADAGPLRKVLEAGGSALVGGGATSIARAAMAAPTWASAALPSVGALFSSTVAPTLGSSGGAKLGQMAAHKMGWDEETGSLIGSLLGGTAYPAGRATYDQLRHGYYADKALPNAPDIAAAAERQGITPSAGMLGNDIIKSAEKNYSGDPGASNYTSNLRRGIREDIGAVIDRAAEARGSTNPNPTPGDIGYDVAQIARLGVDDANAQSSRGQQQLMTRIGPRTDTDVSGILAAMERIRNQTDPGTAAPIDARVNTMRQMLPRDPEGNIISTDVPYERVKDWRTNLRERSQGYDAVPGRFASQIYDETTGAMRDAGASQGVPPGYFDTVQGRTARLTGEGGPVQTLEPISDVRDPMAAYQYVRQGEQAPGNLRTLEATGNPAVGGALGDYIRMMANNTINTANSRGPVNFANRWEGMTQGARDVFGGPQQPALNDAATLARAYDYPPNQL